MRELRETLGGGRVLDHPDRQLRIISIMSNVAILMIVAAALATRHRKEAAKNVSLAL